MIKVKKKIAVFLDFRFFFVNAYSIYNCSFFRKINTIIIMKVA